MRTRSSARSERAGWARSIARDTRLKRDVAIKVLPDAFAADRERFARLQREAEVLATLNHPNMAAVYGLEEGRAIVLELVAGPTLADRIAQGPLSLDDALPIARQIADALEAAHEKGVIHRDLKPANVMGPPQCRDRCALCGGAVPPIAASILVGLVAGIAAWQLKPEPTRPVARFPFILPDGQLLTQTNRLSVAVSPDGTQLVYVANAALNLKPLSGLDAKPIQGTGNSIGITNPVFSPDGRSIAFCHRHRRSLARAGGEFGGPADPDRAELA